MKIRSRLLLILLAVSLLMTGCAASSAESATQTKQTAVPETEPAETQMVQMQPEEETKPAFMENLHDQPSLSDTVLPEDNSATGTLFFYFNDKAIHAGAPVAELMEIGFHTYSDLTQIVQPWHMSGVVRALIDIPDVGEDDEPYVYFIAMNASDEPCMISECIIYSITINYQKDVSFGTGHEEEPFVTGTTTREELVAAYGEPDEVASNRSTYEELFYYQPFNCVSFLCKNDVVMQINAYYGANVYGALAENVGFELTAGAMANDAMILMSQYMDVTAYMPVQTTEEEQTETEEMEETAETGSAEEENTLGILAQFDDSFQLDGNTIAFGTRVSELPSPFLEDLVDLSMPVNRNYYVRTGRHDPEEFLLLNYEGQVNFRSDTLVVKGVIVENPNYCNWGFDNSDFHSFSCQGITENSTIDDVLQQLGQPKELLCSSGERSCFIWMHYATEAGDYIHIRVDPMLNQVIEVNMVKYFEGERKY